MWIQEHKYLTMDTWQRAENMQSCSYFLQYLTLKLRCEATKQAKNLKIDHCRTKCWFSLAMMCNRVLLHFISMNPTQSIAVPYHATIETYFAGELADFACFFL